ncbi:hypothetical protein ATANTOWER_017674 [Ataeniobius toweri]|uniref:Uncharacterized protein n=1 Tax=Ataeniobius toweri TaxID=208326 RepID=A0ABU7A7L9_9TELE|nr:hypothetical protein [Ataeniobius toweri]
MGGTAETTGEKLQQNCALNGPPSASPCWGGQEIYKDKRGTCWQRKPDKKLAKAAIDLPTADSLQHRHTHRPVFVSLVMSRTLTSCWHRRKSIPLSTGNQHVLTTGGSDIHM